MAHLDMLIGASIDAIPGMLIGLIAWLYQRSQTKKERESRAAAEAREENIKLELARFERRAQATNFIPSPVNRDYFRGPWGDIHRSDIGLLNAGKYNQNGIIPEITADRTIIYFPIANAGGKWIEILITGQDGLNVGFFSYIDGDALLSGIVFYNYDPARRDRAEKIMVDFVTMNGITRRDVYEIRHGRREMRRIEPPVLTASV